MRVCMWSERLKISQSLRSFEMTEEAVFYIVSAGQDRRDGRTAIFSEKAGGRCSDRMYYTAIEGGRQ